MFLCLQIWRAFRPIVPPGRKGVTAVTPVTKGGSTRGICVTPFAPGVVTLFGAVTFVPSYVTLVTLVTAFSGGGR
jgi:hypothetical protein